MRFLDALRLHYWQVIFRIAMSILAQVLNPELFWWMLPVTGGLMLAPWLSMLSGTTGVGYVLQRLGLLLTPGAVKTRNSGTTGSPSPAPCPTDAQTCPAACGQ